MRFNTSRTHRFGFDNVARAYDVGRPRFEADTVAIALRAAEIDPRGARVVEIGAGTGQLTGALLDLGCRVDALEPGDSMRDILRSVGPPDALRVSGESFEEWFPTEPRSFDVVAAANAFHWIDPSVAFERVEECLRPGGELFLLWNFPALDESALDAFNELYSRLAPDFVVDDDHYSRIEGSFDDSRKTIESTGRFDRVLTIGMWQSLRLTLVEYQALVMSYANVATMAEEARAELAGQIVATAAGLGLTDVPVRNLLTMRTARLAR